MVLDRVTEGLVVIDETASIVHANRLARELLHQLAPALTGCGQLRFTHARTQSALRSALCACLGVQTGDDDEPAPRQFLARDPHGVVIAHASIESLARHASAEGSAEHFLVLLMPLPGQRAVSAESLVALYGLTAAEARVAARVTTARTVDDLAVDVGLSVNTVKTHLKVVFRKCEVGSFAQLAVLVATTPCPRPHSQRVTDSMSTGRTSARLATVPT